MLIGITGGIGAGKSVVSRILRSKGFEVYDCDLEARLLMDASESLKQQIACRLGEECIRVDGSLDRAKIAGIVFTSDAHRSWLNSVVHAMVHDDLKSRLEQTQSEPFFVESAILHTSGLDRKCAEVWIVTAPEAVRLERVTLRDGIATREIKRRMLAQAHEFETIDALTGVIDNSGHAELLEQIDSLLAGLKI